MSGRAQVQNILLGVMFSLVVGCWENCNTNNTTIYRGRPSQACDLGPAAPTEVVYLGQALADIVVLFVLIFSQHPTRWDVLGLGASQHPTLRHRSVR